MAASASLLAEQYEGWQNPQLQDEMRNILLWAARLHEVGIVINHRGLQKHSAYILQNIELPGFDREQQRLLALLVRLHIGGFRLDDLFAFARYHKADVLALLRLLRLAVILNKSRQATESTQAISLTALRNSADWRLDFAKDYLNNNPLIWNELRQESNQLKDLSLGLIFN